MIAPPGPKLVASGWNVCAPRHPEHQRLTKWYGGSFDPDDINLPVISDRIGKLARRRALGKAGYAKSRGPTH